MKPRTILLSKWLSHVCSWFFAGLWVNMRGLGYDKGLIWQALALCPGVYQALVSFQRKQAPHLHLCSNGGMGLRSPVSGSTPAQVSLNSNSLQLDVETLLFTTPLPSGYLLSSHQSSRVFPKMQAGKREEMWCGNCRLNVKCEGRVPV